MAPPKPSRATAPDDTNLEPVLPSKRQQANQTLPRGRRNGPSTSRKEPVSTDGQVEPQPNSAAQPMNTIASARETAWNETPAPMLHAYRLAHRLSSLPTCHKNPMASLLLSNGIGRSSPTMKCAKAKRRVPKEQLAQAVRKNFNALPVNETDVIVALVYRIRMKDKSFRLRFPASKPQSSNQQPPLQSQPPQEQLPRAPAPKYDGYGGS